MGRMDLGLPKFEDTLFSTQEERDYNKAEKVTKIKVDDIHEFKNHPFHVRMDDDMQKLIDSVKDNGVLLPVLVRPDQNGGYEMISGHRRKYASEVNGMTEIDCIVRDFDDDQAIIFMVDSNIQREHILPSERGFAYKMKLEAMKHQGKKIPIEETSGQVGQKLKSKYSIEILAEEVGESYKQIQRYIRLTYLIKSIRDMVDQTSETGLTMALNPAYEISFLKEKEQQELLDVINDLLATPSLSQAQQIKRLSQNNQLTKYAIEDMLSTDKPNQVQKITFKDKEIDKFFPKDLTPLRKKEIIVDLLEKWAKERQQKRNKGIER